MKEEVKEWWEYSKSNISTAEYLFEGKRYKDASFYCQQSVEKGTKGITFKKK